MAPATRPATPAIRMSLLVALAAATPTTRLAVETMPSFAPSTAAHSQPMRSVRCHSGCGRCKWLDHKKGTSARPSYAPAGSFATLVQHSQQCAADQQNGGDKQNRPISCATVHSAPPRRRSCPQGAGNAERNAPVIPVSRWYRTPGPAALLPRCMRPVQGPRAASVAERSSKESNLMIAVRRLPTPTAAIATRSNNVAKENQLRPSATRSPFNQGTGR